jgi:hypothetical protein
MKNVLLILQIFNSTFQNIPVSLFPKVLSKIYKDNELYVYDVKMKKIVTG